MNGDTEFDTEIEAYENAMDSLHETTSKQSEGFAALDGAMAELKASVAEMHDAVGEYGDAQTELTDAVASLQKTATANQSPTATTGHGPAAAD